MSCQVKWRRRKYSLGKHMEEAAHEHHMQGINVVLPMGFSPGQVHYGYNEMKKMTVKHSWGERVYTQLYSHGGRSITRIPFTQSEPACSKLLCASGPLCPCSHLSLCPRHCHHSSLCSPTALQPCSHAAAQSTGKSSLYRANHNVLPTRV